MTNKLTPPEPLSLYKLHTPEEKKRWEAEMAAYRDALRAEEERTCMKEEATKAFANRVLSDEEYYADAVKREADKQAREAEREAQRQAEADAKAAYLASLPDVASVSERSEFLFLQGVIHWAAKGYTLSDDGITAFLPGFYSVQMVKPVPAKKAK